MMGLHNRSFSNIKTADTRNIRSGVSTSPVMEHDKFHDPFATCYTDDYSSAIHPPERVTQGCALGFESQIYFIEEKGRKPGAPLQISIEVV